jgi:hypothetical protein
MQLPPPEILNDSSNNFHLPMNSQIILNCKAKSSQKPTLKWFKKKDENFQEFIVTNGQTSYKDFMETSRSIKYFENFYEPIVVQSGLKELGENVYLSKLILNNVTQSSVYVCVAINYFGFNYRENLIHIQPLPEVDDDDENYDSIEDSVFDFPERNYKILFLIPVVLFLPISALLCTILYLLINRQILRRNKNRH